MTPLQRSGPIRVLVVDDHQLVADALELALGQSDEFEVVGHATGVADSITQVRATHPDVVVMDLRLADGSGIDATIAIKRELPATEVVILTGYPDGASLARAMEAGCAGFVAKNSRLANLLESIRAAVAGTVYVAPDLMGELVLHLRKQATTTTIELTPREREILQLLARGRSTAQLVGELELSVHTVRNHVRNLLNKLGASSRLEGVALAIRYGLVVLD